MHFAVKLGCVFSLLLIYASLAAEPSMTVPNLAVRTASTGFTTPIAMAFIGANQYLVIEKNTGKVQLVEEGSVVGTALDLNVNFASERGLLGIALHPNFASNHWVYLFWSESTTGTDTDDLLAAPLLGNRIDRYVWANGQLTFDRNIIRLRSLQNDVTNPAPRANHDGGVLAFGPDRKLYAIFGDAGRRGLLQNNSMGPVPDDQFGGPEPDNAHWSGVIMRLNDDGSTPADNPFVGFSGLSAEANANMARTYSYGVRNSFGMAFDPYSGNLWYQENGEDAYDELNLVQPGMNSGWIQIMGPLARVPDYRFIETTIANNEPFPNLQQLRWPSENIALTPAEAFSRLFAPMSSRYVDPVLSWRFAVAPAAIGFVRGRGLGPSFDGDMIMGFSLPLFRGGTLVRFQLTGNRRKLAIENPDWEDGVVDNPDFHDLGSTTQNVIGEEFGVITDIKNGPNGHLFVVSISEGSVFEVFRR
jgi:aldose sugar dehydrogenase